MNNAASSGKITTLRAAPNINAGTYHTSGEMGIKATANFPQARSAAASSGTPASSKSLGRAGQQVLASNTAKPPIHGGDTSA